MRWSALFVTVLLASCASYNRPIATPNNCTKVNSLNINKETRAVIDATLILKVDTRRRKYNPEDFCAYNQPTLNKKYYLLTIYNNVTNHISPTWMLMSRKMVVDTQLNDYQMSKDSIRTHDKIIISVTRLPGLDSVSRKELIQMMQKDAKDARKR
jgi:hypothetical protein